MSGGWGTIGRQTHRWSGLAASLVLAAIAASGLLLAHPRWLGPPVERTLSLAAHPADPAVLLRGTTDGLWRSLDAGETWQEAHLLMGLVDVVGVAYAPDDTLAVYAAGRDQGVVRSADGGWVWEAAGRGGLPEHLRIERLAAAAGGRLHLWTDRGAFTSSDRGGTWTAVGEEVAAAPGLRERVHDLHTGRLFGPAHALANDLTAIACLALVGTGWILWLGGRRRGRQEAPPDDRRRGCAAGVAAVIAGAAVVALAISVAHGDGPAAAERTAACRLDRLRVMMGTMARVSVWAPDSLAAEAAVDAAFAALARTDSLMSTWRDDSDVARINRSAGRDTVLVAPEVVAVTQAALACARASDGAFDPTVLPLLELWGLHGGGAARVPAPAEIARCLALVDHRLVAIDTAGGRIHLAREGMKLDLGAIAKGHAAAAALAAARERGAAGAVVDLGGNLGAFGEGPGDRAMVRDPRQSEAVAGSVALGDIRRGARFVATSGAGERFIEIEGRRYGHILDPRTGAPVDRAGASVSVIGSDGALTDALATAIFVLGPREGLALARLWPGIGALFLAAGPGGGFEAETTGLPGWRPPGRD